MNDFLLYFFVFPGFLFLSIAGILFSWAERKAGARLQWRVGPPVLQPFYDIAKLFFKEQTCLKAQIPGSLSLRQLLRLFL